MSKLDIKKIESLSDLIALKADYFAASNGPLDGMWHFGFVAMATHFGFYEDDTLIGYLCINDEGYILQFHLAQEAKIDKRDLFKLIAQGHSQVIGTLKGAFVSTAESDYLSLCLDNSVGFKVNALMYQALKPRPIATEIGLSLSLASADQLSEFVDFAASNIGAPKAWLSGYYENLINRNELWGYWEKGELLACGECRFFDDYQTEYADLGVIVAQAERGKGLATRVLAWLSMHADEKGLKAICSTESTNVPAQKAISRAGFATSNRIVQFDFERFDS